MLIDINEFNEELSASSIIFDLACKQNGVSIPCDNGGHVYPSEWVREMMQEAEKEAVAQLQALASASSGIYS